MKIIAHKISEPSRIVNISSKIHTLGKIEKDNLNSEKSYGPLQNYANSKLANVLFTKELARQLEGTRVTTYALHPGVVNTEVVRHWTLFNVIIKIGMSNHVVLCP
jgi:NAD(P)-dependent dehydrogenase (short-subunit alcohol dehydrogenase family)